VSYDRNAPLLDLGIVSTVIVAAVFIFGGAALRWLLRH
jgi:hypothetical protein